MPVDPERFPRGKLNAADEGALAIRIACRDRTVIVDFGKRVAWIGLSAADSRELAAMLLKNAEEADNG